jgi:cytochrome c-type biogenesis protein CcmH
MIWIFLAFLAAVALTPFGWAVWRGGHVRGRRDAALALHQAQLAELDRDLEEGRIMEAEHAAAQLEVQRRLLADAELSESEAGRSGKLAIILTAVLVPAVALTLYVEIGVPNYRQAAASAETAAGAESRAQAVARDAELIEKLKAALATMDPSAPRTREGYVMLGNAELSVGDLPGAADAWRKALAARFDPLLGAETAEIITDSQGHVTPEAAALFKRALAEAPPDVKWRKAAEKRLQEAGGS